MAGRPLDGSDIYLFLGDPYVLVGCGTNVTLTVNRETREVSCKATGKFTEKVKGPISWTMSLEGLTKVYSSAEKTAGNIGYDDLYDDMVADTPVPAKVGSTTVGDPQWEGDVLHTSWELTGSNDGESTYTVTLEGTGPLVKTTVSA